MKFKEMDRISIKTCIIASISIILILLSSCSKNQKPLLIITRTEVSLNNISNILPLKEQIVKIDPENYSAQPVVISDGFFSARSPQVSYDGKKIILSAKKDQESPWQIWEMSINGSGEKQIVSLPGNCTHPLYLPGNRIVFTKSPLVTDSTKGEQIFTCNLDGTDIRLITFSPDSYKSAAVMSDGRLLILQKKILPDEGPAVLMAMRPDGTKTELFSQSPEGLSIAGSVSEINDGRIIFIESGVTDGNRMSLASINYNRPLHSRVSLSSGVEGDFSNAASWRDGKLLVSYRRSDNETYGLCEFDPVSKSLGKPVYEDKSFNITGVIVAEIHNRPKKLPSEVDMGVKTGLVFCQDINIHGNNYSGGINQVITSKRIEILGVDSVLGVVDTEEDGSFYLKVIADTPFRIRTLDDKGNVLYGPCDWVWVRPNERRGCVGCHEDHEIVPDNRRPLSVIKDPVGIPVHINKVVEKKVSLE